MRFGFYQKIGSLLGVFILLQTLLMPLALARYDIIHLYNGKVMRGKIIASPGELIRVRTGVGAETSIPRIQINGRDDIVLTTNHKLYRGEINYIDPFQLEIVTEHGRFKIWRMLINKIIMGVPVNGGPPDTDAPSVSVGPFPKK